jgi:hypothetical protein
MIEFMALMFFILSLPAMIFFAGFSFGYMHGKGKI